MQAVLQHKHNFRQLLSSALQLHQILTLLLCLISFNGSACWQTAFEVKQLVITLGFAHSQ